MILTISFIAILDIDECAEDIDGCAQTCTNSVGDYSCACDIGYHLASNRHSCNDVDECVLDTHGCNQTCTNTVGSYTCSCDSGYGLASDGQMCIGESRHLLVICDLHTNYHTCRC